MAESVVKSHFPSQTANDIEKASSKYGLDVARAIENEWFKRDSATNRFYVNQNAYHKLRLYAALFKVASILHCALHPVNVNTCPFPGQ